MRGVAHTLVRSPSSTVAPPSDGELGRKALEVLQRLTHDARALKDEGPLGEGGMGVGHRARQVSLDRRVAITPCESARAGRSFFRVRPVDESLVENLCASAPPPSACVETSGRWAGDAARADAGDAGR